MAQSFRTVFDQNTVVKSTRKGKTLICTLYNKGEKIITQKHPIHEWYDEFVEECAEETMMTGSQELY